MWLPKIYGQTYYEKFKLNLMKQIPSMLKLLILFLLLNAPLFGQEDVVDTQDLGRMWTFENPPVEWFQEAYDFEPDQAWFDHVRKSSLRFASWCSASFVSPNGLIMTNHHCSRDESLKTQLMGEDIMKDGFYAKTLKEERKVHGLFVEQLIQAEDVSDLFDSLLDKDPDRDVIRVTKQIEDSFQNKPGWENLRIQVISYYSGAKHSVYGYKRYEDIRLVIVPEVQIGFYGGEEDNFTYPRYNLDFTFWRAYDKNGKPVDSSKNYMQFNPNGPEEGEPVFVIGNPYRTERYKTVAQLEYDRDISYPALIDRITRLYEKLNEQYQQSQDPVIKNRMFRYSNSLKVFHGTLKGLKDDELMSRKLAMENKLRKSAGDDEAWRKIEVLTKELAMNSWARNLLGPNPDQGKTFMLMHSLYKYESQMKKGYEANELEITRQEILKSLDGIGDDSDQAALNELFTQLEKYIPKYNMTLDKLIGKRGTEAYIDHLLAKSSFYEPSKAAKLLKMKEDKFLKNNDPLLEASRALVGAYEKATEVFKVNAQEIVENEQKIARQAFRVFGDQLSPDATFTLRLSDGIVKGYEYNGTVAPWKTSFFGLYDRYYSHSGAESWDLPEKWMNPDPEILKIPMNFVSTNDIIGGNSGSPIINRDKEVVGLIFDGNIESLPGNFIFDQKTCRAVSVHTAGMLASLKYVYKAERIVKELVGNN
jgi:hypothetical protein